MINLNFQPIEINNLQRDRPLDTLWDILLIKWCEVGKYDKCEWLPYLRCDPGLYKKETK